MKPKTIKILAVAVLACLVIGALPFLSTNINLTPQVATTSLYPEIQFSYNPSKGTIIMKGKSPMQEVIDADELAVAWLDETGQSQLITVEAWFIYNFLGWTNGGWLCNPDMPLNALGGYWFNVYYTDTSGTDTLILSTENGMSYKSDYVTLQGTTGGIDSFLRMPGGSKGYKFPSVQNYYVLGANDYAKSKMWDGHFARTDDAQMSWKSTTGLQDWNTDISGKDWWFTTTGSQPVYTQTLKFFMKGQRPGTLRVNVLCEQAEREVYTGTWGCSSGRWHLATSLIAQDYVKLSSGTGTVNILPTSTSTVANPTDKPEEIKDGTGTDPDNGVVDTTQPTYAERIFQEGETVSYEVTTGYAGTDGWTLAIWDAKGELIQSSVTKLANNLLRAKKTFVIPKGNFDPSIGLNEYTVVLTNGLWKQGLAYMFVVDTKERMPGATTVTSDKQQYVVGNIVTTKMWAQATTASGPVKKFRVEVRWDSTGGPLVTGFTNPALILASSVGGRYEGTFSFAITQASRNCYVLANALAGTNSEYPGNTGQCYFSAIPLDQTFQVTIEAKGGSPLLAIPGATVQFGGEVRTTGTDGRCIFNVKANDYALKITKTGYDQYVDTVHVTMNKIYTIPLTAEGGGVTPETQDVYIDVYNKSSSAKLQGATVSIDGGTSKQTGSTGSAFFSAVTKTTHELSVTKAGYEDFTQSISVPDDLTEGRFAVLMVQTGGQTGVTYDVSVDVINSVTTEYVMDATVTIGSITQSTGTTGTAQFTLAEGSYTATASKDGFTSKDEPISVSGTTFAQIFLVPGETPVLPGEKYTVTLTVTSPDGLSVTGATAQLGNLIQTTDGVGMTTFTGIDSGDQYLSISHPDYEFYAQTVSVTADTPVSATLTVGTPPVNGKCTVDVTVKDAKTGAIIDGATVNIGGVTKTTSSGIATVEVDIGTVSIVVAKTGYTPFSRQINVNSNMQFTVSLTATVTPQPTPGFEIVGLIVALGIAFILFKRKQVKKE